MREKILVFSFIILVLSIVVASEAFAECKQEGKTEVTIVNPAGKVLTICVPEHVVEHIGGPGDVVIPATCPCWSATSIDLYARELEPYTSDCLDAPVQYKDDGSLDRLVTFLRNFENRILRLEVIWDSFFITDQKCAWFDTDNNISIVKLGISSDEARACRALLVDSEMWALNCEGP